MSELRNYPLCWPDNVARTAPNKRSAPRFGDHTVAEACAFVIAEINRLNDRWHGYQDESVIISTNIKPKLSGLPSSGQSEPADTGVAVYFQLVLHTGGKSHSRPVVLTCDRWARVAWNLYAIGKDIEAQRGRLRWGCTSVEQAFRGYLSIPERTGGECWWERLKIKPTATEAEIKEAFRIRALTEHPDKGGTADGWAALQEAY